MNCNIFNKIEKVFVNMGDCIESLADNRKKDAFKSLLGVGKSLGELTYETTSCIIENTPKAVSTIKEIKEEIINEVEKEVNDYKKAKKEKELEELIKKLK